jgi:hypothetical protein
MRIREGLAVMVLALALTACESGFSEADIEQTKQDIRSEYEKRPGLTVVDVQMIKESPTKLTGFVKMKPKGLPKSLGTLGEISKSCSATLGENRQYIWRCE